MAKNTVKDLSARASKPKLRRSRKRIKSETKPTQPSKSPSKLGDFLSWIGLVVGLIFIITLHGKDDLNGTTSSYRRGYDGRVVVRDAW